MKNNFFLIVLGLIIGTCMTVYALNSENVGFISKDEAWKVKDIKSALNDLYTESVTTIPNLQENIKTKDSSITSLNTQISTINNKVTTLNKQKTDLTTETKELEGYLSNISTDVEILKFTSSTSKQTFDVGFEPSYIACNTKYNASNGNGDIIAIYNKDYSETNVARGMAGKGGITIADTTISSYYTINSNGFTWNIASTGVNGSTVYCIVSK